MWSGKDGLDGCIQAPPPCLGPCPLDHPLHLLLPPPLPLEKSLHWLNSASTGATYLHLFHAARLTQLPISALRYLRWHKHALRHVCDSTGLACIISRWGGWIALPHHGMIPHEQASLRKGNKLGKKGETSCLTSSCPCAGLLFFLCREAFSHVKPHLLSSHRLAAFSAA